MMRKVKDDCCSQTQENKNILRNRNGKALHKGLLFSFLFFDKVLHKGLLSCDIIVHFSFDTTIVLASLIDGRDYTLPVKHWEILSPNLAVY